MMRRIVDIFVDVTKSERSSCECLGPTISPSAVASTETVLMKHQRACARVRDRLFHAVPPVPGGEPFESGNVIPHRACRPSAVAGSLSQLLSRSPDIVRVNALWFFV